MENQPRLKNPHLNSISVYNTQKYRACSRLWDSRVCWIEKGFLFPAPPTFHMPFTFASSLLSQSLEQANKYLVWLPASNLMSSFGWRLQLHFLICGSLLTKNVWFTTNYSSISTIDHLLHKATTSHRRPLIGNTLQSETTTVRTSHKRPPLARNCDHV